MANSELSELPDVQSLSYEQARDELKQVVVRLEAGGEPLEASLAMWERGEALANRCQEWLDGARMRLAAVQNDAPSGVSGAESPTADPGDED